QTALDRARFWAQRISVDPRPDERHIRAQDLLDVEPAVTTEFSIEGDPKERTLALVETVRPAQCTLVPDAEDAITSNAGWDTRNHLEYLREIIAFLQEKGIRTSIFVDPVPEMIRYAAETGTDRVELYTEPYAKGYVTNPAEAIKPYLEAARLGASLGLEINAGHDLDLNNLRYLRQNMPELVEDSIGHALICDALYLGLENTIHLYWRQLV